MKFAIISDFFTFDGINGGGEKSNDVLAFLLREAGHEVILVNSHLVKKENIKSHIKYIVCNFLNLKNDVREKLQRFRNYIIYEHDQKWLATRDPSKFKNFEVPKNQLRNMRFFECALSVVCQSNIHAGVIEKNTGLENLYNLGGNLWSKEELDYINKIRIPKEEKERKYTIYNSSNPIKGKGDALKYCILKNLDYELVGGLTSLEFYDKLNQNLFLVFFPNVLESFNRMVVEARMLGCSTLTNGNVGAISEEWYKTTKGEELVELMRTKHKQIIEHLEGIFL